MSLTTAQLGTLRNAITTAGATFPKAVNQTLSERDKIAADAAAYNPATTDQVADAICAALLRGDDPADDEQVRHLTTSHAIASNSGGLAHSVVEAADRRVVAALTAAADHILAILHEAGAKAGDALVEAHSILGAADLNDSQAILNMGPGAARAWAEAREAQQAIKVLDRGWTALANLTNFASTSTAPTSRLANLDLETFEKVGRKAEPWAIVCAGGTIDLADADTIRQREDRIAQERQARQDGHATALQQQAGQRYKFTAA